MFDIEKEVRTVIREVMDENPISSARACGRIYDEWHRKNVMHARTLNAFEAWFIEHGMEAEYEAVLESIET